MTVNNGGSTTQMPDRTLRFAPFLASFLTAGLLFAIQQWIAARVWYPKAELHLPAVIGAWELQYSLWGLLCWLLWRWQGPKLQTAGWRFIVFRIVPLSILMSVGVEMALAAAFPQFPVTRYPLTFWRRLDLSLAEEFLENTAIFWATFAILRAMGHHRESRQKERDMSELAIELTEARLAALRMQINPHFLFNTMNAISSLMYIDVAAADKMLEQLSAMLRVSLERGSRQLICLWEEIEFVEMYLSLQDLRYSGKVRQQIRIDPHVHDALIPTMLLQPLIENAYVHGLSKVTSGGLIEVAAHAENGQLIVSVRNNGAGLAPQGGQIIEGSGIGLANIRNRLRLHFGDEAQLDMREGAHQMVEVVVTFPLVFAPISYTPAASVSHVHAISQ
jgi:signal transduction histidine kinase